MFTDYLFVNFKSCDHVPCEAWAGGAILLSFMFLVRRELVVQYYWVSCSLWGVSWWYNIIERHVHCEACAGGTILLSGMFLVRRVLVVQYYWVACSLWGMCWWCYIIEWLLLSCYCGQWCVFSVDLQLRLCCNLYLASSTPQQN